MKILLTTTSFQDVPGEHQQILENSGYKIIRARGPLSEEKMLNLVGDVDGLLCGDDKITQAVIDKALPRLKVISKYGIGLDKINIDYATEKGIPLTFCPGVNHTTVAEHTFALLLALSRKLVTEVNHTAKGEWVRLTGCEIMGKTIAIIGLGRVGKEVAKRAKAFGMNLIAFGSYWDENFAKEYQVKRCQTLEEALFNADIISLHKNLTDEARGLINKDRIKKMKPNTIILNCARGELVNQQDLADALNKNQLAGYATDVLDEEPPSRDHPILNAKNALVTPHIGSRTHESVQRQALMAVRNLTLVLKGKKPLAQANKI